MSYVQRPDLDASTGLGFSLKPPKFVRKAATAVKRAVTLKRVLIGGAVVAGALVAGPAVAAGLKIGARAVGRGAGGLLKFGKKIAGGMLSPGGGGEASPPADFAPPQVDIAPPMQPIAALPLPDAPVSMPPPSGSEYVPPSMLSPAPTDTTSAAPAQAGFPAWALPVAGVAALVLVPKLMGGSSRPRRRRARR